MTHRTGPIRLLIVERQALLSPSIRSVLARDPAFQVLGSVSSAVEATRAARAQAPDVAICEATLPDPGAVELARFFRVRMPGTKTVFMSRAVSEEDLFEAVRAGAAAYLVANQDARLFATALVRVANGEYLIDEEVMRHPAVASRILSQFRQAPAAEAAPPAQPFPALSDAFAPLFVPLSAREIEILDLVARGNSNKLIARRLGISDQAVKNHITTILRKLEVNDRTEAVVTALRNGWIRIDSPTTALGR